MIRSTIFLTIAVLMATPMLAQSPQEVRHKLSDERYIQVSIVSQMVVFDAQGVPQNQALGGRTELQEGVWRTSGRFRIGGFEGYSKVRMRDYSVDRVTIDFQVWKTGESEPFHDGTHELTRLTKLQIDLGSSPTGETVQVTLWPQFDVTPPAPTYPSPLFRFGSPDTIVIRNREEFVTRGGSRTMNESFDGSLIQQLLLLRPQRPALVISYHPFPGAERAGYAENGRLIVLDGDDVYEWISTENPLMPEGRWALYVAEDDEMIGDDFRLGARIGPKAAR
ncbi:MAG TPA: hypothetical protein VLV83_01750 [Acidobacteriota bacterium]|nr:hypothetical protein [Acidobacteriota bacterium]